MNVLVGDSQAEGLKPSFSSRPSWRVFDHRGWSTRRLRDDALPEALALRPSLVVLVTGGNDDPDAPGYAEVVRSTADLVRRAGAQLVWVGPVFAKVMPDAIAHPRVSVIQSQALTGKPGVRFVDAQLLTRDLARDTNVHLDAAGYRVYAQRIGTALQPSAGTGGVFFAAALGLLAYAYVRATRPRA